MKLNNEQTKKLRYYLMQKRPSIARQDERESSRIEGETGHGDRDVQGYRAVAAFIQRGLGDQMEIVRQVLDIAAKVQNDNNLNFPVVLFSFGWDDGILHGKGRPRSGGPNIPCNGWATELCDMASAETSPVPQKTPSLFPPAKQTGAPLKVTGEDLLIFFCKDRSVRLTDEAMARYAKPLKHAVWIYCGDDRAEMALGIKEAIMSTENKTAVETETRKEQKMKLSKSSVPKASGALACKGKRCRGLSPDFMADLKSGTLNPILESVKADDTLSLNIRGNCVNIYYRGGSLLKITELSKKRYSFEFDNKYLNSAGLGRLGISPLDIDSLSGRITAEDRDGVDRWVHHIPALQAVMNMWLGEHPHLERELQQLVERMNNSNSSTDYFICDIEYKKSGCKEFRLDLIALFWPSTPTFRKKLDCGRLAIIEMKHNDDSIPDKCGIVEHVSLLDNSVIVFSDLCDEMRTVFNQRVELGLIKCHTSSKQPQLTTIKSDEKVDYIILLSDHDPAKSRLCDELAGLQKYLKNNRSRFNIKVALATFTGYGLFEESMYTLDQFMTQFSKQIMSSSKPRDNV